MCSTKALLAGDGDVLSDIYRKRVINRGASAFEWGVNFNNSKIQG
jgi:formate dehydrogenase iron-sulfur subunit